MLPDGSVGSPFFAIPKPLGKKSSFRFKLSQLKRLSEMTGGSLKILQPRLEFADNRVKQIIRTQLSPVPNRRKCVKPRFGTVHIRNCDGAIKGNDRGTINQHPLIIKRQDSWPISGLIILSSAVAGRNPGLEVVLAEILTRRRLA